MLQSKDNRKKYVFSRDLKVVREPLLMMNEGSEFQRDGAAHRRAHFASSVLVIGTVSSEVSDERNVRVDSRGLM